MIIDCSSMAEAMFPEMNGETGMTDPSGGKYRNAYADIR